MIKRIRNVIVHPRLRKLRRWLMGLIPSNLEVPILSGSLKGSRWITGAGYPGYWLGTFERDKQTFIANLILPNTVVYDVGAHVGFYTLLAARKVGPRGKIYAFEPVKDNLSYLKKNIEVNNLQNVTVVQSAISDFNGVVNFDFGMSSYNGQISDSGGIEVSAQSLDSFFQSASIEPPDLIKIDVEGAESRVLDGAQKLLTQVKPTLLIAIHGTDQLNLCHQKLKELDYYVEELGSSEVGVHFDLLAELIATANSV